MKLILRQLICGMGMLLFVQSTAGHQLSTSYLTLHASDQGEVLTGQFESDFFDLHQQLQLDLNGDSSVTWSEVSDSYPVIVDYLQQQLTLHRADQLCQVQFSATPFAVKRGTSLLLHSRFEAKCAASGPLSVKFDGLFNVNSQHKVLLSYIDEQHSPTSALLTTQSRQATLAHTSQGAFSRSWEFFKQGIIHILIGIDHILFLIATLLTVCFYREKNKWQTRHDNRQIWKQSFWIVTAFTLAHSVTLTLTALNVLSPDFYWIELGIALSVGLTALNNLWPLITRLGWLTFGFGLLHGMGFASVLAELGVQTSKSLLVILAFNFGVEVGQLMIIALLLPMLFWLRNWRHYRMGVMTSGSVVLLAVSCFWFWQRW